MQYGVCKLLKGNCSVGKAMASRQSLQNAYLHHIQVRATSDQQQITTEKELWHKASLLSTLPFGMRTPMATAICHRPCIAACTPHSPALDIAVLACL
jgi:hypothetical protein